MRLYISDKFFLLEVAHDLAVVDYLDDDGAHDDECDHETEDQSQPVAGDHPSGYLVAVDLVVALDHLQHLAPAVGQVLQLAPPHLLVEGLL